MAVFILIVLHGSGKFLDVGGPWNYLSVQSMVSCTHLVSDTPQGPGIQKQIKSSLTEYPNNIVWLLNFGIFFDKMKILAVSSI